MVTFPPIFTRLRDIAAFMLQHATSSPIPPLISPKFPDVSLGVGGWPLGYEDSEGVGLVVRAISFQHFQPM